MRKPADQVARRVVAVLLLALAGGCGYRLGSSLPRDIRTVCIPAFVNESGEPLLETVATREALQALQNDGTLRVTDAASADTLVRVTLVRSTLEAIRYDKTDTKAAAEYRLKLLASVTFRRVRNDELLSETLVEGETTFEPLPDLPSAKAAALPAAARDLAHKIVESVIEFW